MFTAAPEGTQSPGGTHMSNLLSLAFAAAFSVLSLTAMVMPAHAFDYTMDDDGDEENAADFAYEMAAGGYQELMEEFEDDDFDEVELDDADEDEDEDEDE